MVNAESIKEEINSGFWIEDPAPGDSGNDEGKCIGKQENVPQNRVTDQLSVDEQRQHQSKTHGQGEKQDGEDHHVPQVRVPTRHRKHLQIGEAERIPQIHVHAQRSPLRQGNPNRDPNEDVNKNNYRDHRRREDDRREPRLVESALPCFLRPRSSLQNVSVGQSFFYWGAGLHLHQFR